MKDLIRMNQLAGLITENQAQKMMAVLNENYTVGQAIKGVEGEDAEVKENTDGHDVSHKWSDKGYHTLKGKVKDGKLIAHSYETDSKDSEVKDWYQEKFDSIKDKPVNYEKTSGGFFASAFGDITTID